MIKETPIQLTSWITKCKPKTSDIIGYARIQGSDFQNSQFTNIVCKPSGAHAIFLPIDATNLFAACVHFAVRLSIEDSWLTHNDLFSYPKDSWWDDQEFQWDCLVYTLFHGKNRIKSAEGLNHWVPFDEDTVGAKDEIKSHFMIDILKGKTSLATRACEEDDLFAFAAGKSGSPGSIGQSGTSFSSEAQAVLDAALPLYRYYHEHLNSNPNASFYDIRLRFQGLNDKGKMNNTSPDEKYNELIASLRLAQKHLASKIAEGVYRHGFLK